MAHNHKHELIKSPLQAVNQYEGAFVKEGNKFIADGLADVLQYIAAETANAIKQ